jgi:hypothetical protein
VFFVELSEYGFCGSSATLFCEHVHDNHLFNKTLTKNLKQIDKKDTRRFLWNQFERRLGKTLDVLVATEFLDFLANLPESHSRSDHCDALVALWLLPQLLL